MKQVNPLVTNGQKLIPSVTRVFHTSRDVYVYVQGYEQKMIVPQPLVAYVTLYRNKTKAFESQLIEANNVMLNQLKTVPIELTLKLEAVTPGAYDFQITIMNPKAQQASFWRAPIVLIR